MKQLQHFSAFFLALVIPCLFATCSDSSESKHPSESSEAEGHDDDEGHDEDAIVELSPEASAMAQIRAVAVEERVLEVELETTGAVDFDQNRITHVSPRVSGRVSRVSAELGAFVQADEVLVRVDSIELGKSRAEYLQAKAQEDLARENYEREKGLFADRISSEREMLVARAAYQAAQAALQTAKATLHLYGLSEAKVAELHYDDPQASIYEVRAPFSGKVVEKHVTLGELVTPEMNLFVLADLSQVWIWIDVYERDLSRIHLEDFANVRTEAYPGEVFRGRISYLSDSVDPDTRTIRARIDAPNPDGKLRPGMFTRIKVSDPHDVDGRMGGSKALAVPESAVQRDGERFIAFVPLGQNRFERRELRIGRKAGDYVEILDGLQDGESVVAEGSFLLKSEAAKAEMGEGHAH